MSNAAPRWTLLSLKLSDLLGFQGDYTLEFGPGLQVLEASNHTGKTSIATGLLWGLTGQIPALPRLDRKSYRLSNKHAGENAQTSVVVRLKDASGRLMEIRRPYAGRTRGEDSVELTVGDEELTGAEANARILLELGVAQSSLEGCGVVLQDHRLKLITGKDTEISEVINDMLGLEALSEVVPVLETQGTEADHLRKEIETYLSAGNPLVRWQEESSRIENDYKTRENRALASGFDAGALETPDQLAQEELAELAAALKMPAPGKSAKIPAEVERLRKQLGTLRKAMPLVGQLSNLTSLRPPLEAAVKGTRKLAKKWREHGETLNQEAARGDLSLEVLSRTITECDQALVANKAVAGEKHEVQDLLEVAYTHLLQHPALSACPLCEGKVAGAKLIASVRARIDTELVEELERLAGEETALKAKRKNAEKRRGEVQELTATHHHLVQETQTEIEHLSEIGQKVQWAAEEKALFSDGGARTSLATALEETIAKLDGRVSELQGEEDALQSQIEQQEESVFQPLETRLNRVRDALAPLLDVLEALESHGELRDAAEQRTGELDRILRDARDTAGRLKKIAAAVSEAESKRATAAIKARLPMVSEFFASVAGNPDFTGLTIDTSLTRNKVAYNMRATSSRMAALGDAVGHVLSEGDMSAAGMALLLGLASGDSHHLGFLLLDDPAQGMDPTLQRNFARELANLSKRPQVIILTHQPDFADALASHGAERKSLGRWEGGRLSDG